MTVLMRHPDHGWTHAYSQGEVDRLKENGWAEVTPPPIVLPVLDKPPKRPTLKVKR